MSSNATPERCLAPRPAFISLPNAVKAAIAHGNTNPFELNLTHWARTYPPATVEDVRLEFDRQLSLKSLKPSNSFEQGDYCK